MKVTLKRSIDAIRQSDSRQPLWIREAYDLHLDDDGLPPLLADSPAVANGPALTESTGATWELVWPRLWRAAARHAGRDKDPGQFIRAWRTGPTKVVSIPCAGEFFRRITDNALLMTDATRADSAAYQRALNSFG